MSRYAIIEIPEESLNSRIRNNDEELKRVINKALKDSDYFILTDSKCLSVGK